MTSTCPSGLSRCLVSKQRCHWPKELCLKKKLIQFFHFKILISCIFCLKYFYHMLHTCFMTYEVWWGMYYKIWTFNNVFNSVFQIIWREKVRNEALDYESDPKFLFSTFGLYKFFFWNKYIYVKIATLLIFDIFYFGTNITQIVFSFITYPTVTWCFCFVFAKELLTCLMYLFSLQVHITDLFVHVLMGTTQHLPIIT